MLNVDVLVACDRFGAGFGSDMSSGFDQDTVSCDTVVM